MMPLIHETMIAISWIVFVIALALAVTAALGGAQRLAEWAAARWRDTGPYPTEHGEREP